VDVLPVVLGNGKIRLELRPQIAEIDESRSIVVEGIRVPRIRTRTMDAAVEVDSGQTVAIGRLIQARRATPSPYEAHPERPNSPDEEEIELIVLATPQIVATCLPPRVQVWPSPIVPGRVFTQPPAVAQPPQAEATRVY
jgi:pilus assembly protein CpaC